MQRAKQLKRGELILMSAPIVALLAVSLVLRGKHEPNGPFRYSVDKVTFHELPPRHKDNWRLKVTAYLGHKGATPTWWGTPCSFWMNPISFVERNGKVHPAGAMAATTDGGFDQASQEYCYTIIVNTDATPPFEKPSVYKAYVEVRDRRFRVVARLPISTQINLTP